MTERAALWNRTCTLFRAGQITKQQYDKKHAEIWGPEV